MWMLISQGSASTVSVWWTPASNRLVDMEHNSYGIYAVASTYRSSIDSDITLGSRGMSRACSYMFRVLQMTLCVLATTDSKVMQSSYWQFRCVPGVGSYVNNMCLHVEIRRWLEYECSVISRTITLARRVHLRWAWISLLNEEMFSGIPRVRLESTSRVLEYDRSTQYHIESLSIPGWLEIYGDGSVSGE
jgi:hypothetical protein